jgi:MscS family membrane protein
MINIGWFAIPLPEELAFLSQPFFSFLATFLAWILVAVMVNFIFTRLLRWVMRNIPGEVEDIILGIIRKPVLILLIVFGAVQALRFLNLPDNVIDFIQKTANTIIVLVLVYLSWRVVKDVVIYYGTRWARRTESRLDDVILPVLNLIGPLVIIITASLIILPMWGVDISSILVPAGVIGLVLGLALQDPLANIFSGISLLIEAPFRTGDLIILDDGRVCQVEKMGLRSTQFYSIEEHSTVFVPNRTLTNTTLVNITQPTVEQKLFIDVAVPASRDMSEIQIKLQEIAMAHPCVLVPEMEQKFPLLKFRIEKIRQQAARLPLRDSHRQLLEEDADRAEEAIPRLEVEDHLNRLMLAFQEALRAQFRAIQARETKGLTAEELKEILDFYVQPADEKVQELIAVSREWSTIVDPWMNHREYINNRELWIDRNIQIQAKWERLKKEIQRPSDDMEMRLDDATQELLDWLERDYKIPPYPWKTPKVVFLAFELSDSGYMMNLRLYFHVDNIRLEHDTRAGRVKTELARQIREQFIEDGIWQ